MSQSDSSLQRAAVAGDIMSTPVVFVRPDATVQDTAALLLERGSAPFQSWTKVGR